MEHDKFTNIIQAMPFTEGKIGLTTSATPIKGITLIHCNEDGGLDLTFPSGGTVSVTMLEGADRSIAKGSSVVITSGFFDFD